MNDVIPEEQLPAEVAAEEPANPDTEQPEAQPEPENEAEKYRKIAEDQRKRAEKAEAENKKLKQTPSSNDLSPANQQRLDRIELNSLGIKDREEQDFVLSAAKRMGVDPSEAASDEIVTAKLEKMRETKRTKDATPAPSRGAASSTNIERLAKKALETGELPTDPDTRAKVKAEMKRLSKRA